MNKQKRLKESKLQADLSHLTSDTEFDDSDVDQELECEKDAESDDYSSDSEIEQGVNTAVPSSSVSNDSQYPNWGKKQIQSIAKSFTKDHGPSDIVKNLEEPTPFSLFSLLFSEEIIKDIVFQTNLYCQQSGKHFTPVDEKEIKTFLGIHILMGIKKYPSYRDHWSSKPTMNDPFISKLMTVNRFGWLLSNLHLNDNILMPSRYQPNFDSLYKVRPYLDKLQKNFENCFLPGNHLVVDESIIKFRGRHSTKQYLPDKIIKKGYRVWVLADQSGYVLNFNVYKGKEGNQVERNFGGRVVKSLVTGLEGGEHQIYFDNYFTNYMLMKELKESHIPACGTINANRKYLPKFKDEKLFQRGEHEWFTSKDKICAFKWKNNRCVHLLSNFHNPKEVVEISRRNRDGSRVCINCPVAIDEYNKFMNIVDKFDQLKATYDIENKSQKFWHRIFFHFLNAAVINANILYEFLDLPAISKKDFRLGIVDGFTAEKIVELCIQLTFESPILEKKRKLQVSSEIRKKESKHQPIRLESRRRCARCSTKNKQVRTDWLCSVCKVPLCLSKNKVCFQKYHE